MWLVMQSVQCPSTSSSKRFSLGIFRPNPVDIVLFEVLLQTERLSNFFHFSVSSSRSIKCEGYGAVTTTRLLVQLTFQQEVTAESIFVTINDVVSRNVLLQEPLRRQLKRHLPNLALAMISRRRGRNPPGFQLAY